LKKLQVLSAESFDSLTLTTDYTYTCHGEFCGSSLIYSLTVGRLDTNQLVQV